MWKKIGLTILLFLVVISIGLGIYLYNHDYLIIWKYSINKEIEFEDYIVKIEEISLYNFNIRDDFNKQFELQMYIGKLPRFMRKTFINAYLVLNPPYETDNEFLRIELSGKIISNDFNNPNSKSIFENVKVDIIDELGVNYSSGRSWSHNSSSKVTPFQISDEHFRADKKDNIITIVVTDLEKNDSNQFEIKPKYIKETRNYFYTRPW